MVSWKSPGSSERLLSALFAAHPNLKPNYHAIAAYYGDGVSPTAIESRLSHHRKEGRRLCDTEEGDDLASGRRPNPTPSSSANKRSAKKATFSKNKKGCFSSSESCSEVDTPSKKPKVERIGAMASDPISLVDSEASSPVDLTSGTAFTIKAERGQCRIKREAFTPAPTPSRPLFFRRVNGQRFVHVDDDDNDLFVDQERGDDDKNAGVYGKYSFGRLATL